jgi:uncharacterized membrane protein YphA (DoxX/SURF4 family)
MSKVSTVAVRAASIVLALALIGMGVVELLDPAALGAIATWGYPARFHVLVAALEISGGLLFLVPPLAWWGAVVLGIVLGGAIGTHFQTGTMQLLLPAGGLLVGGAVIGYVHHPRTLALARLRAVADAVAEREMAQHRGRLASRAEPRKEPRATTAKTRPVDPGAVATKAVSRSSGA